MAEADLIERARHYRRAGGDALGTRFFDTAVNTLRVIGRLPRAGSPRAGELTGIHGLRVRLLDGFPCGWFYFVADDHVDVVRLLGERQDLGAILSELEP